MRNLDRATRSQRRALLRSVTLAAALGACFDVEPGAAPADGPAAALIAPPQVTLWAGAVRRVPITVTEWRLGCLPHGPGSGAAALAHNAPMANALAVADMIGAIAHGRVDYFRLNDAEPAALADRVTAGRRHGPDERRAFDAPPPAYYALWARGQLGRDLLATSQVRDPATLAVSATRPPSGQLRELPIENAGSTKPVRIDLEWPDPTRGTRTMIERADGRLASVNVRIKGVVEPVPGAMPAPRAWTSPGSQVTVATAAYGLGVLTAEGT
jgi:hypothetical protein